MKRLIAICMTLCLVGRSWVAKRKPKSKKTTTTSTPEGTTTQTDTSTIKTSGETHRREMTGSANQTIHEEPRRIGEALFLSEIRQNKAAVFPAIYFLPTDASAREVMSVAPASSKTFLARGFVGIIGMD